MSSPTGHPAPNQSPSTPTDELAAILQERIDGSRQSLDRLNALQEDGVCVLMSVQTIILNGGTLLTCGNGGSAAQALHLSQELLGRFKANRPSLASICLNADPTVLTCIANDFGFEHVFARQVEALASSGDGLVVFSTSGKSKNVVAALRAARQVGATTIGFLGGSGGEALAECDVAVLIDGDDTASIQEAHQTLLHACCQALEPRVEGGPHQ